MSLRSLFSSLLRSPLGRGWWNHQPPLTPSVLEWCQARKIPFQIMTPATNFVRPLPKTLSGPLHTQYEKISDLQVPPRFLVQLENVTFVGDHGFMILSDGSFATEIAAGYSQVIQEHPSYFKCHRPTPRVFDVPCFSLLSWHCRAPYHWIHEAIPRLREALPLLPPEIHFLVPDSLGTPQREALQALGISPQKWISYREQEPLLCKSLWYVPPFPVTEQDTPELVSWLQKQLQSLTIPRSPSKLYISRSQAARRRIINESELIDRLKPLNFEVVHLENLTLSQQLSYFSNAQAIIGPHGAGFTWLFMAPPQTPILEIFDPSLHPPTYWSMSSARGLDYSYLIGESTSNPGNEADIRLSAEALNRIETWAREN